MIEEIEELEGGEVRPLVSCGLGMASLHGSKPLRILIGLALLCLLAGVFYVGPTLPPSEPPDQAEEQPQTEESAALEDLEKLDSLDGPDEAPPPQAAERPRTAESAALDDLDRLDSLDGDDPLMRIIEDDPERFYGGPCEAWVTEAPSE